MEQEDFKPPRRKEIFDLAVEELISIEAHRDAEGAWEAVKEVCSVAEVVDQRLEVMMGELLREEGMLQVPVLVWVYLQVYVRSGIVSNLRGLDNDAIAVTERDKVTTVATAAYKALNAFQLSFNRGKAYQVLGIGKIGAIERLGKLAVAEGMKAIEQQLLEDFPDPGMIRFLGKLYNPQLIRQGLAELGVPRITSIKEILLQIVENIELDFSKKAKYYPSVRLLDSDLLAVFEGSSQSVIELKVLLQGVGLEDGEVAVMWLGYVVGLCKGLWNSPSQLGKDHAQLKESLQALRDDSRVALEPFKEGNRLRSERNRHLLVHGEALGKIVARRLVGEVRRKKRVRKKS